MALACALALPGLAGCGGDADDDTEARKPDSGYGAAQTAPTVRICTDFCTRLADCGRALCVEDTHSERAEGVDEVVYGQCSAQCTDSVLNSNLTAQQWDCLFQSSCRESIDYDECKVGATYRCTL